MINTTVFHYETRHIAFIIVDFQPNYQFKDPKDAFECQKKC